MAGFTGAILATIAHFKGIVIAMIAEFVTT